MKAALTWMCALSLLGCAAGTAHRAQGEVLDDAEIHASLKARLLDDPRVDANEVNIEVRDGVVTLVGWVTDDSEKRTVEQLAWSVHGVKEVVNHLQVRGSAHTSGSAP